MKKISDEDVLRATKELYKQIESETPSERKSNCKFYGKSQGRYCLASSHTTCSRCKYFEPTILAKFRALVKNNEKLRYSIEELTTENKSLQLKIKMLESMMDDEWHVDRLFDKDTIISYWVEGVSKSEAIDELLADEDIEYVLNLDPICIFKNKVDEYLYSEIEV